MHVVQNESLLFLFVKHLLFSYEVIKKGLLFPQTQGINHSIFRDCTYRDRVTLLVRVTEIAEQGRLIINQNDTLQGDFLILVKIQMHVIENESLLKQLLVNFEVIKKDLILPRIPIRNSTHAPFAADFYPNQSARGLTKNKIKVTIVR